MRRNPQNDTIAEPASQINICKEADVVVVGGGPAVLPQLSQLPAMAPVRFSWKGTDILEA